MFSVKQRYYRYHLYNAWYDAVLDWGLNPGPAVLEASTIPLGYRGGGDNIHNFCNMFLRSSFLNNTKRPGLIVEVYISACKNHIQVKLYWVVVQSLLMIITLQRCIYYMKSSYIRYYSAIVRNVDLLEQKLYDKIYICLTLVHSELCVHLCILSYVYTCAFLVRCTLVHS